LIRQSYEQDTSLWEVFYGKNMKEEGYRAIFDMDGTLYRFDKGRGQEFTASRFYSDLKNNVYGFFMARRGMDREQAITEYERIKDKYKGEISLGVEAEYRIDRYGFFVETWGTLDPAEYIEANEALPEVLNALRGKIALLTAAPLVWAVKVLAHLNLEEAFGDVVYTGEPDLRKPNPQAFQQIADDFGVEVSQVFSIGDQEESDIAPAQAIGMRTVRVGQGETRADYQAEDVITAVNFLKRVGLL
jgi:HAD superfamily hydrolase (TIGR01549 family)